MKKPILLTIACLIGCFCIFGSGASLVQHQHSLYSQHSHFHQKLSIPTSKESHPLSFVPCIMAELADDDEIPSYSQSSYIKTVVDKVRIESYLANHVNILIKSRQFIQTEVTRTPFFILFQCFKADLA